jgi:hypothetical protein
MPWRCWARWTPPAPTPRSWRPRPARRSTGTPTPRYHQLRGPWPAHRRPGLGRARRRPLPLCWGQGGQGYAGAAPVTRASGKGVLVSHRRVKNQRLATAGYRWAFAALAASPGAHAHYQRRRAAGDAHPRPCATCSTGCSAACTIACRPSSPTRSPPRSPQAQRQPARLDAHPRGMPCPRAPWRAGCAAAPPASGPPARRPQRPGTRWCR